MNWRMAVVLVVFMFAFLMCHVEAETLYQHVHEKPAGANYYGDEVYKVSRRPHFFKYLSLTDSTRIYFRKLNDDGTPHKCVGAKVVCKKKGVLGCSERQFEKKL